MNKLMFSAIIAATMFAVAPSQAMPLAGADQSVSRTNDAIVLARVPYHVWYHCSSYRNRHQRNACEQRHMYWW